MMMMLHLRVNSEQELSLMCPDSGWRNSFDKFGVLVDQPRLSQNIGSRIFKLEMRRKRRRVK